MRSLPTSMLSLSGNEIGAYNDQVLFVDCWIANNGGAAGNCEAKENFHGLYSGADSVAASISLH